MDGLKKRKPIFAFLLSFVTPGLGQIYNGQFKKGISYLVGVFLINMVFSFLLLKFYGAILYLIIEIGLLLFILIDAVRGANKLKAITLKPFNKWYIYLIIFLLSAVISQVLLWTIKNNVAKAYRMPSSSMAPTLLAGDHLIADMRIYKKPQRGDMIVFEFPKDPSKEFIKRVIAIEGEKVEIIDNKIYINDKLLDDPLGYFEEGGFAKKYPGLEAFGPVVVPKDSLFVLGDNRNYSMDSRHWGFLDIKKVKG